jgi:hypothetical protein
MQIKQIYGSLLSHEQIYFPVFTPNLAFDLI